MRHHCARTFHCQQQRVSLDVFLFLFNYFSFGFSSCTRIDLADGSIIKKYLDSARSLSYEERGKLLESDTAFTAGHQELALEGQTEANPDVRVYHHFIALVHKDGKLLELDGRKSFPVQHGATTEETLLVVSLSPFHFFTTFKIKFTTRHRLKGCGKGLQRVYGP